MGERFYLMDENPTAENIARLIFRHCIEAGLPIRAVTLWETDRCQASYGQERPPE
jgi:6-pyruvoyltetrahydropterin/6-carboxytetrahydropterin synthase